MPLRHFLPLPLPPYLYLNHLKRLTHSHSCAGGMLHMVKKQDYTLHWRILQTEGGGGGWGRGTVKEGKRKFNIISAVAPIQVPSDYKSLSAQLRHPTNSASTSALPR